MAVAAVAAGEEGGGDSDRLRFGTAWNRLEPSGTEWNRLGPMTGRHQGVTGGLAVDGAPLPD